MKNIEGMPQDENGQTLMGSILNPEEQTEENTQTIHVEENYDAYRELGNLSPEQMEIEKAKMRAERAKRRK